MIWRWTLRGQLAPVDPPVEARGQRGGIEQAREPDPRDAERVTDQPYERARAAAAGERGDDIALAQLVPQPCRRRRLLAGARWASEASAVALIAPTLVPHQIDTARRAPRAPAAAPTARRPHRRRGRRPPGARRPRSAGGLGPDDPDAEPRPLRRSGHIGQTATIAGPGMAWGAAHVGIGPWVGPRTGPNPRRGGGDVRIGSRPGPRFRARARPGPHPRRRRRHAVGDRPDGVPAAPGAA